MASTELTAREETELDNLARSLVVPLDRLITAMLQEWPEPTQMPPRLYAPFEILTDAFAALLAHPTLQRLREDEA